MGAYVEPSGKTAPKKMISRPKKNRPEKMEPAASAKALGWAQAQQVQRITRRSVL